MYLANENAKQHKNEQTNQMTNETWSNFSEKSERKEKWQNFLILTAKLSRGRLSDMHFSLHRAKKAIIIMKLFTIYYICIVEKRKISLECVWRAMANDLCEFCKCIYGADGS